MKTPHKLDRTRQAAPQVCEWLRGSILSLQLAQEGLVDIFPQHATLVSRIDIASATQAHFLRCAIELEVVRTLALAAAEDTSVLRAKLTAQIDLQAALAIADTEEFIASDQAFHRLMYEAAGAPDLFELVRRRSGHLDRLRRLDLPSPGKAERVVRDHRAIMAALAARDPEAAQAAMRTHLSGTLGRIEDIRARHPDYVAA